jgi:hypothetical protein
MMRRRDPSELHLSPSTFNCTSASALCAARICAVAEAAVPESRDWRGVGVVDLTVSVEAGRSAQEDPLGVQKYTRGVPQLNANTGKTSSSPSPTGLQRAHTILSSCTRMSHSLASSASQIHMQRGCESSRTAKRFPQALHPSHDTPNLGGSISFLGCWLEEESFGSALRGLVIYADPSCPLWSLVRLCEQRVS